MKRVALDKKDKKIKDFVRALGGDAEGSILELEGKPVVRVLPVGAEAVDKAQVKAAILRRREASRTLNRDWEAADREMWERIPETQE